MTNPAIRYSCLLAVVPGVALAAGAINGPLAGYAADPVRPQLRPIFGVPGALTFGNPIALPDGVTRIHLAPGQDFALVERAGAAPAVLALKDGVVDSVASIDGAMATPDWVAFSAAGGSALLYASSGRMQAISGLPGAPRIAMDLDASALPEAFRAGALSDDGTLVLGASGSSVYRLSQDGGSQLVLSVNAVASVSILRDGTSAVVADSGAGSIHLLRNLTSSPVSSVLASGLDGIGAIAASWDGSAVFAARTDGISSVDLASGAVQTFGSAASPVSLLPLRNRDTFLISARPNQPGWMFYRDGSAGRVVFIPAVPAVAREAVR